MVSKEGTGARPGRLVRGLARAVEAHGGAIYEQTSGTKRPLGESRALEGLVGIGVIHLQAYHWLDYDAVALAVLVIGISAVTLLALSI